MSGEPPVADTPEFWAWHKRELDVQARLIAARQPPPFRPDPHLIERHRWCSEEWGEWLLWTTLPLSLALVAALAFLAWRVVTGGCP